jgi:hypothetical protein
MLSRDLPSAIYPRFNSTAAAIRRRKAASSSLERPFGTSKRGMDGHVDHPFLPTNVLRSSLAQLKKRPLPKAPIFV